MTNTSHDHEHAISDAVGLLITMPSHEQMFLFYPLSLCLYPLKDTNHDHEHAISSMSKWPEISRGLCIPFEQNGAGAPCQKSREVRPLGQPVANCDRFSEAPQSGFAFTRLVPRGVTCL